MSETDLALPAGFRFFKVLCNFGVIRPDSADPDKFPDFRTQGGQVAIVSNAPRIRHLAVTGAGRMVNLPDEVFTVQPSTGALLDAQGEALYLLDPLSDDIDPRGFTYTATVKSATDTTPWTVTFGGQIQLPAEVDLVRMASIAPSTGTSSLEQRVATLEASAGSPATLTWADITNKPAVIAAGATAADARTAIGAGTSDLAIGTTGTTAAAGNRQATATAIGMVELATTAEATAGTDTQRAVTPAGLKAVADTKAPVRTTPTVVTDATYTLAAGDENTGIRTTSATAVTVTVPSTLPVGYTCPILVDGAGMVTVVAGSGVTLVHAEPPVSRKTGSAMAVQVVDHARVWVVGDLA